MRTFAGLALLITASAAGCLGGGTGDDLSASGPDATAQPRGSSPAPSGNAPSGPASTDGGEKDGGTLAGLVLDDEFRPVPDVAISVFKRHGGDGTSLHVTSNATGAFRMTNLEAGDYLLYAEHKAFEEAPPTSATVEEGKTTELQITLVPKAQRVPFTTTEILEDSAQWQFYVDHPVSGVTKGTQVIGGNHDIQVADNESATLETILVEMVWQDTQNVCRHAGMFSLFAPGERARPVADQFDDRSVETNAYLWRTFPSYDQPIRYEIPRRGDDPVAIHSPHRNGLHGEPQEIDGQWEIEIDRNDGTVPQGGTIPMTYCSINTPIQAYLTFFYNAPLPAQAPDYTALPG